MDKVAEALKHDAERIDVAVSAELDERIRASLTAMAAEQRPRTGATARPAWFWWTSSLTGIAAASVLIVFLNLTGSGSRESDGVTTSGSATTFPTLSWQVEPAVLTTPLEQEMADLQSDIRKAEQALRDDLERILEAAPNP